MEKGQNTLEALLNFFLFSDIDDESSLDEYLKENDIDIDSVSDRLNKNFKKLKAELKLKEGEKFKQKYLDALNTADSNPLDENNDSTSTARLAARKQTEEFTDNEVNDLKSEDEKLKLIKKLKDDI